MDGDVCRMVVDGFRSRLPRSLTNRDFVLASSPSELVWWGGGGGGEGGWKRG